MSDLSVINDDDLDFEHLFLGSGGNHNLRPGCRRRLLGHFTPSLGTLRLDESAVPMMSINWDQVN